MALDTNMISDAELEALPAPVREQYGEAERFGREAVTLFDFGVARGLLLALKRTGFIDSSTLDRMFKRVWSVVPKEVLDGIPPEHAAGLGRGIIVPASLTTRRGRTIKR